MQHRGATMPSVGESIHAPVRRQIGVHQGKGSTEPAPF